MCVFSYKAVTHLSAVLVQWPTNSCCKAYVILVATLAIASLSIHIRAVVLSQLALEVQKSSKYKLSICGRWANFLQNIFDPVLSFPPDRLNLHRWFTICWTMRQFSDVQTFASLIYGLMRWLISRSLKPPFWFLARHQTYLFVFPRHQSVRSYLKLSVFEALTISRANFGKSWL